MKKLFLLTFFVISILLSLQVNAEVKINSWQCQFSIDGKKTKDWTNSTTGRECLKNKQPGYILYRANISLDSGDKDQTLSIYLGTIGEADEFFLDNKLIGKTGGFPPAYLNSMHRPRIYHLGNSNLIDGHEIFIKVYSEFPVNRGLNLNKVKIGSHVDISKKFFWEDFKSTTSLTFILILFLITTLFTCTIYLQKSHKPIHLWASLTSLFMASYTFFLSRYGYEFNISNFINYKALVSSAMLIPISLVGFSYSLVSNKISKILIALGILNFCQLLYIQNLNTVLQLRDAYKNWFLLFICIIIVMIIHFMNLAQKNSRAKFMLIGTFIFLLTAINDITITLGLRSGVNIAHYGLASFAITFIISEIYDLLSEIKNSLQIEARYETKRAISLAIIEQNAQVAHDIGSPLAALDMVTEVLTDIPEDMRVLIRSSVSRIKDIANHLVKSNDQNITSNNMKSNESEKKEIHLLSSVIESLVSEKRMQLRTQIGIKIESELYDSYGIFCELKAQDFKRVLSNLINNSAESLNESGKITIKIYPKNNFAAIMITDNGKGIPKEILPTLMQKGNTYGKTSGSGLGLFHAKTIIEEMGGTITLDSIQGHGTTVEILLPLKNSPEWFVPALKINSNSTICILDDDISIHQIWKERFERFRKTNHEINIINFSKAYDAMEWIKENNNDQIIFLIDYELLDQNVNGLEVIEKLNISSQSILITSRFEEFTVRKKSKELHVKLVPKGLAGFVPIIFNEHVIMDKNISVLIDDDPLIHLIWKSAAQKNDIELKIFNDIKSFQSFIDSFNFNTNIYIDSDLKSSITGEIFAEELFTLGFKNIILTTGHDPSRFGDMPHIKTIIGKTPPWSIRNKYR